MSAPKRPPEHVLEFIREHFEYNSETGDLMRLDLRSLEWEFVNYNLNAALTCRSQIGVSVDGKMYPIRPHNICYYLKAGVWPSREIDHIDNDPSNNKWSNLRLANRSIQGINRSYHSRNYLVGVNFNKTSSSNPFVARIRIGGKEIHLGSFPNQFDAHIAYCNAYKEHHGEDLPVPYRQIPWTESDLDFCESTNREHPHAS